MKKIFLVSLLALLFSMNVAPRVSGQNTNQVTLYFFWGKGCSHCQKEEVFLKKLSQKYPQIEIKSFEVNTNHENLKLLQQIGQELEVRTPGVFPFTAVGKYHFVGFLSEETTGKQIEEAVNCALTTGCPDVVGDLIESRQTPAEKVKAQVVPETLSLPLLGEIKTKNFSLPLLTIIIGGLDGFNPCAMWALLFLISLLLGMKNRTKMWLLGITFIATSALVYFLFMAAWLNFFLFLGFLVWVRILLGLFALAAGGYNIRDYWLNRKGGCEVVEEKKRKRVFDQIKQVSQQKSFLLALGGIILLAFAVNLIELICSAGLPAIYTQVLALSQLPIWQYYGYLLLYILFFMLDDLFVFMIAMVTLRAVGIERKYVRWSRLIGGSLMIVIGLLMLFRPAALMFG